VLGNFSRRSKKMVRSLAQKKRSWCASDMSRCWPGRLAQTSRSRENTEARWLKTTRQSRALGEQRHFAHAKDRPRDQRWPRKQAIVRKGQRTCLVCHWTVWCPLEKEGGQSDDSYPLCRSCWVHHQTVRCTRRQKATGAFQM
jgi:hypothetical protein